MTKISNQYSLTNVLFADAVNGRVGIGTSSPTVALDVVGAGKFTNSGASDELLSINSTFADGYRAILRLNNTHTGGKAWDIYSTNNGDGVYGGGKFVIRNNTDNVNALTITSAGNVGIGTSSPTVAGGAFTGLDIRGSGGGSLVLGSTSSAFSFIYANSSALFLESTSTIPMAFVTNGTERMRITSAGAINILGSYFLANSGTGYRFNNQADSFNNFVILDNGNATLRGTLTQNASDERLKNNIKIIPNAIDKIKQLRGVSFNWNQELYETSRTTDIGVIAQDIQKVLPDAVSLAPFDINFSDYTSKSGKNYLTVYYEKIIPLLIEGIKEQEIKIQELSAQSSEQQLQINELKALLNA